MRNPLGCKRMALGVVALVVALASTSNVALAQDNSTEAPVATPTAPPVPAPTEAPVPAPTTDSPTDAPVEAPVTDAPTDAPVEAPVTDAPTDAPVAAPVTDAPVAAPVTDAPTDAPTATPSVSPVTEVPTATPSSRPTRMPVNYPTTFDPTMAPSASPSDAPTTTAPTRMPVDYPTTVDPTAAPVEEDAPTAAPAPQMGETIDANFEVMAMGLVGLAEKLTDIGVRIDFETSYEQYVEDFYKDDNEVEVKEIRVVFVDSNVRSGRRRERSLQGSTTEVIFNIRSTYQTSDENLQAGNFINKPFNSGTKRDKYAIDWLKPTNSFFDPVETVEQLQFPAPTAPPPPSGMDTNTIIIIAVCAGVGGMLCIGGGWWWYRRGQKKEKGYGGAGDDVGPDGEGKPPSQLQLSTLAGPDEVSTLAEPTPRMGVIQGGESLAGYGDQSVATVDYDYSKAYGGGGDSIVSETGGTLGSGTRGGATATGESAAAGPSAAGASQSVFSDSSFTELGGSSGVKEELIDIYAPPGKLGVVIDTPDDGPPVVHAIKDSSVISDQLKVGDKLVSVDDDDVRSMTAIKVSKIISRKSANPTRKLSIIRTSVG
eukprot:CAMPEP_0197436788 /NCGR_PEP_ID=MMETSP1175-20131217/4183_1 /TAXON_ID=1003142 /ORGANISM="Triceratium dubium, Strain CCMP147" /LENGTH=595 /DNA_ID=CAMNT_0042966169 /DNA_START=710 /DNA_END=2497 /DNA_ORIENTATION=-